jgi:hypothetical protein
MTGCAVCGTIIVFGGFKESGYRFCNNTCLLEGRRMIDAAANMSEEQARRLREGPCPLCRRPGAIGIYTYHRVWSLLLFTAWQSESLIGCRRCGAKAQLGAILFCLAFGWWGIPWGFIGTPAQVIRNVVGLIRGYDPSSRPPLVIGAGSQERTRRALQRFRASKGARNG